VGGPPSPWMLTMALGCRALAIAARFVDAGSEAGVRRPATWPSARRAPSRAWRMRSVVSHVKVCSGKPRRRWPGCCRLAWQVLRSPPRPVGHLPCLIEASFRAVVAGVEEHDHAGNVGGGGRDGGDKRRRGNEQSAVAIAAPTRRLAGTGATVAPLATTLKAQTRRLWMSATKSRPISKGTVMQPGGTPDMSALLAQAQQVQQQLMEAQEALANSEVARARPAAVWCRSP